MCLLSVTFGEGEVQISCEDDAKQNAALRKEQRLSQKSEACYRFLGKASVMDCRSDCEANA